MQKRLRSSLIHCETTKSNLPCFCHTLGWLASKDELVECWLLVLSSRGMLPWAVYKRALRGWKKALTIGNTSAWPTYLYAVLERSTLTRMRERRMERVRDGLVDWTPRCRSDRCTFEPRTSSLRSLAAQTSIPASILPTMVDRL